jgi:hypothetical protein
MKRKIFLTFIIYAGIVFIFCQILNYVFPSESIVFQRQLVDNIIQKKDDIQSLTFGRSHGTSIDYNYWDYKGVNFSMGGEDIASIKYEVEYAVPELKNLKEVIICISYSSLYFDNEALSHGNLNDARKAVYASIPSFKLISPNDYNNLVFGKMFAFMHAEYGFKELMNVFKRKDIAANSIVGEVQTHLVLDSLGILKSAKIQAFDHSRDKISALEYNPKILEQYVNHLTDIALYLKSKNVKCIFFSAPYYKAYTDLYPKADIRETELQIKNICLKTGSSYYNFSRLSKMANNISLFANADHLNTTGHKEFSKLFSNVLHDNNSAKYDLNGAGIIK